MSFSASVAIELGPLVWFLLLFNLAATADTIARKTVPSRDMPLQNRTVERSAWDTEHHVESSCHPLSAELVYRFRRRGQRATASWDYHYWNEVDD